MGWHTTSRQSRGYGPEWDKTRRRILARDCGICQPCLKQGHIHPGTEVDHIISKAKAKAMGWTQGQMDSDDNLQAINTECHKAKTAEEMGRTLRPRVTIGLDGYPVSDTTNNGQR